jgi:hypothetical protein
MTNQTNAPKKSIIHIGFKNFGVRIYKNSFHKHQFIFDVNRVFGIIRLCAFNLCFDCSWFCKVATNA